MERISFSHGRGWNVGFLSSVEPEIYGAEWILLLHEQVLINGEHELLNKYFCIIFQIVSVTSKLLATSIGDYINHVQDCWRWCVIRM